MSEKICLQWNDFQENVKSAFGNMREDKDFTDVTLVCEDGEQVEAHKVILAASSPHRAWAIFYSKRISQTFCFKEKSKSIVGGHKFWF